MVIFEALGLIYLLFNSLNGIVCAIWLMILGEWGALWKGIVLIFGGSFFLGLVLFPGLIFMLPVVFFEKHKFKIGIYFVSVLSLAYTYIVIAIWCLLCLYYFKSISTKESLIPITLWGYGAAFAPIAFLASKERENEFTAFTTLLMNICLIVSVFAILVFEIRFQSVFLIFVIGFFINIIMSLKHQIYLMSNN